MYAMEYSLAFYNILKKSLGFHVIVKINIFHERMTLTIFRMLFSRVNIFDLV